MVRSVVPTQSSAMRVLPLLVLLCVAVLSVEASAKCKYFGQSCGTARCCISGYFKKGYVCRPNKLIGTCAKLCRFGGYWCPDGKVCRNTKAGRRCIWWGKHGKVRRCRNAGDHCAKGRRCIHCYWRSGLCCRRASLIGKRKYCGVRYRVGKYGKHGKHGKYGKCGKYTKKGCWQWRYGRYCADGKSCIKGKFGKRVCVWKRKVSWGCRRFGQICGWKGRRNCVPCYSRKGYCCRRRSTLNGCAKHCRYGGRWCPHKTTCRQTIVHGIVTRRCVYIPRCRRYGQTCGPYRSRVCLRCHGKKLCCRNGYTKGKCQKKCSGYGRYCTLSPCPKGYPGWCCHRRVKCKGKKYCHKG